jgi:hypothetical protein
MFKALTFNAWPHGMRIVARCAVCLLMPTVAAQVTGFGLADAQRRAVGEEVVVEKSSRSESPLMAAVERAGGKVVEGLEGVVSIDLFNGNNPTKGQGGPNEAVTDEWLACLEGCSSLKKLSLQNCAITNDGLVHLQRLTGLEELSLAFTPVSDAGLKHLAGLTSLRRLSLAATQCTGAGFKHLRGIRSLNNVNFHFTPLDDDGLKEIVATGVSDRLWFVHTRFTDAGAACLTGLKNLRICGMGSKAEGSSGAAVAFLKELPRLEDLTLEDNQADPSGIAHAAAIRTLRRLDLSYAPEADDVSLRKVASMPALEEFTVAGSARITGAGVLALAESKSLKKIALGQMKHLADDIEALRKRRPDLEVIVR